MPVEMRESVEATLAEIALLKRDHNKKMLEIEEKHRRGPRPSGLSLASMITEVQQINPEWESKLRDLQVSS